MCGADSWLRGPLFILHTCYPSVEALEVHPRPHHKERTHGESQQGAGRGMDRQVVLMRESVLEKLVQPCWKTRLTQVGAIAGAGAAERSFCSVKCSVLSSPAVFLHDIPHNEGELNSCWHSNSLGVDI